MIKKEKRSKTSLLYAERFRKLLIVLFPSIPLKRAHEIALYATEPYSSRVGRVGLDNEKITLAVKAYIRHSLTKYEQHIRERLVSSNADANQDELQKIRDEIRIQVEQIAEQWMLSSYPPKPTKDTKPDKPPKTKPGSMTDIAQKMRLGWYVDKLQRTYHLSDEQINQAAEMAGLTLDELNKSI